MTRPHRLIYATDLHIGTSGPINEEGIATVFDRIDSIISGQENISTTGILFGGDFLNKPLTPSDNGSSFPVFHHLIQRIQTLCARAIPMYAVTGNHDSATPDWIDYYLPALHAAGVVFLDSEELNFSGVANIGEVAVLGTPDFTLEENRTWYRTKFFGVASELRTQIDPNSPLIVLTHNPDAHSDITNHFDNPETVILSGHSHGGMIDPNRGRLAKMLARVAVRAASMTRADLVFQKATRTPGGGLHINSAGLGLHPIHGNRFNNPELYVLEIVPRLNR